MNRFGDVEALLAGTADGFAVPAVAAAAIVDGKLEHVAAHGWADVGKRHRATTDTPTRWYSISKPLTGLVCARLVAQGRLRWDQPVTRLVPGLRFADPVATERADVRDCFLHRTGLISGDWTWYGAPSDPAVLLQRLPHVPCRPGYRGGFHYQNLNFAVLMAVLNAVGVDWHQAIRDLLGPLGVRPMTRLAEFVASDRLLPYGPNGFTPPRVAADFDFAAIAPASSVCGSIAELAQVARLIALQGAVDGETIVPRAAWDEALRPVFALGDTEWPELRSSCAGIAGRTVVYRGETVCAWAGGFTGYTAHIVAMPGRRAAACAVCNRSACPASDLLALAMLDRAVGWEPLPWRDRMLEQKRKARTRATERMEQRRNRPAADWPCERAAVCGRFSHPAYGHLDVCEAGGEMRLRFRDVEAVLVPRPDGTVSADGASPESPEVSWDLRLDRDGGTVAWLFNPDDAQAPCRFERERAR
jgi:CubicO group peptidase (beta-lactamase class C family)